ncbi:MAG: hypothetical protein HC849_28315 [Oscillatoriales cyanobacterium RU_3_3]|nr:hypothetical protein [Microcoleus sp. SU_5_6]NJM63196.1 hypothetical protein [Oscillatoriales cyanobacterium RU_3_3]NJR22532.1 hypothetical protein [Richelia sp. CSU_2_1]
MKERNQLLILDLDETLIYATETPLNRKAKFLEQLQPTENIRSLEKRFWRDRLARAIGNSEISNSPPAASQTDEVD